ncbi:MAG: tRNA lysidine(34) synthetase TilS [Verrucomicrobia bacterium]|nr:tRNA lysidine(34) synthetase TilS [Verrucomicrobiota bacterium]
MDRFFESVCLEIRERGLFSPRQRILIAASGGVDSMVLVECLSRILPARRCAFALAHFNHRLRGQAGDADERLVRRTARRLGVAFFRGDGDVRALAQSRGVSIEMAAREMRQSFLSRVAKAEGFRCVAAAHHADDQAELFLMRACRGAGGEGLAGMGYSDPFPGARGLRIARPLLGRGKSEIRAWATEQGIEFREDASNERLDCRRNHIRHEILPRLRKEWGEGVADAIRRSMDIVGGDARFVEAQARVWIDGDSNADWSELDLAVQRHATRCQLADLGVEATFDLVESLRVSPGKPIAVSKSGKNRSGIVIRDDQGRVGWWTPPSVSAWPDVFLEVDLSGESGRVSLGKKELRWETRLKCPLGWPSRRSAGVEVFDGSQVGARVVLRRWRPGDRYRPLGLGGTAKLQDLFINTKVPRADRETRWVACLASGDIFWVEGLRPGEDVKVTLQTRRWLVWSMVDTSGRTVSPADQ